MVFNQWNLKEKVNTPVVINYSHEDVDELDSDGRIMWIAVDLQAGGHVVGGASVPCVDC
jgi:hypothetical protein